MTLQEIITARKTRKGRATRVTSDGAYWQTEFKINASGGDGIGSSAASVGHYIEVRHYRDGHMRAYVGRRTWHDNYGSSNIRARADDLLSCETVEDLIRVAQGHEIVDQECAYNVRVSEHFRSRLPEMLPEMPESLPAPDEA